MQGLTNYMKDGRDPTWIELFFDLAYAVILGRLSHLLFHTHHGHIATEDIIAFVWIFMIMFMVWMLYTVYMNIYGNGSLRQTLYGFVLMSCLFAVAALMHNVMHYAPFIAGVMGVMSFVIALLYSRSLDVMPENRQYAVYKLRASIVLGLISISAVFMPSMTAIVVVLSVYFGEHMLDELFLKRFGMAKPDGAHFVERIGIFIILLCGESFITLVGNLPEEITFSSMLPVALILVVLFGMFVNYFTHNEQMAEVEYSRYCQLLAYNSIVMIAFTLLPAVVYHGEHQELTHHAFKVLVILFLVFFYFGNGLSYRMVPGRKLWQTGIYAVGFPVIFSGLIWATQTYMQTLLVLSGIVVLTAVLVIIFARE